MKFFANIVLKNPCNLDRYPSNLLMNSSDIKIKNQNNIIKSVFAVYRTRE